MKIEWKKLCTLEELLNVRIHYGHVLKRVKTKQKTKKRKS